MRAAFLKVGHRITSQPELEQVRAVMKVQLPGVNEVEHNPAPQRFTPKKLVVSGVWDSESEGVRATGLLP